VSVHNEGKYVKPGRKNGRPLASGQPFVTVRVK